MSPNHKKQSESAQIDKLTSDLQVETTRSANLMKQMQDLIGHVDRLHQVRDEQSQKIATLETE